MGHALSIDAVINIIFGIAMTAIGVITIAQTAHLARLYSRSTVPDIELGPAASLEADITATDPITEDQTYTSRRFGRTEVNMQASRETIAGSGIENKGGCIDSVSVAEQAQGIATSTTDEETQSDVQAII